MSFQSTGWSFLYNNNNNDEDFQLPSQNRICFFKIFNDLFMFFLCLWVCCTVYTLPNLTAVADTVDHKLLHLLQCTCIGICGMAPNWCKSSLTNRSLCVSTGSYSANTTFLPCSVPHRVCCHFILYLKKTSCCLPFLHWWYPDIPATEARHQLLNLQFSHSKTWLSLNPHQNKA